MSASTETGRPPESARAATRARCLGVPRSSVAPSRLASTGPSTPTRTPTPGRIRTTGAVRRDVRDGPRLTATRTRRSFLPMEADGAPPRRQRIGAYAVVGRGHDILLTRL